MTTSIMEKTTRHATQDDMMAIASVCRRSIPDYEPRIKAALTSLERKGISLYLCDYPLHAAVSEKIADYCLTHGLDAMELIPEDIIYS